MAATPDGNYAGGWQRPPQAYSGQTQLWQVPPTAAPQRRDGGRGTRSPKHDLNDAPGDPKIGKHAPGDPKYAAAAAQTWAARRAELDPQ